MPKKLKDASKDELPVGAERAAEHESDAPAEAAAEDTGSQLVDEEQIDAANAEAETDTDQVMPAEVAAIHADTETAREATDGKPAGRAARAAAPAKERTRSAKYAKAAALVDVRKAYPLARALELARESSYTTFTGSVELHARLMPKKGKAAEAVRGLMQLPHGTGKQVNAAVLTQDMIDQIASTKQVPYDVLIAPKALMPKVAAIAKILGPVGKMPSPKSGTVADNPDEALAAIQSGRVEYRSDASGNIHLTVGKIDWDAGKLLENAQAAVNALPKNQLQSLTVTATMGPGVRVDVAAL